MKGVNIFLADGFEDIEALAVYDVLVRGGVDVKLVSVSGRESVVSSHSLQVKADCNLDDLDLCACGAGPDDVMIFPGGMPGAANLSACIPLVSALAGHYSEGGRVAAICAAPGLVLGQLDNLEGVEFTCYDGFEDGMAAKGASFCPKPVVVSGRVITGRGPGYSVDFALKILECLKGGAVADNVRSGLHSGDI